MIRMNLSQEQVDLIYEDTDPWGLKDLETEKFRKVQILNSTPKRYYRRILDIGCGEGFITNDLQVTLYTNQIIGIDLSKKAINRARKKAPENVHYIEADFATIDPESLGKFDLILVNQFIYNVIDEDLDLMIDKIMSLLNNGGDILLCDRLVEESRLTFYDKVTMKFKSKLNLLTYERLPYREYEAFIATFTNQIQISVIIPTCNRALVLPRAVKSVLNQSFKSFELIIVSDGSEDVVNHMITQFIDPRVSYIIREKNSFEEGKEKGIAINPVNDGLKIARGKYVCHLDDDDFYRQGRLSLMYNLFEIQPEDVGLIYCDSIIHFRDNEGKYIIWRDRSVDPEGFKDEIIIGSCEVMYRRKLVDEFGLWDDFRGCVEYRNSKDDRHFYKKVVSKYKIKHVPIVLCEIIKAEPERLFKTDIPETELAEEILSKKREGLSGWFYPEEE